MFGGYGGMLKNGTVRRRTIFSDQQKRNETILDARGNLFARRGRGYVLDF